MAHPQSGNSELTRYLEASFYDADFATVPDTTFDVVKYGATNDGKTRCTGAIQDAIDAAAAAGGGVVIFPKGTYLTGALFLKDNVEFRLDAGVVLKAVQDESAYPEKQTRIGGIEMEWPAAVLNVNGRKNVRITGHGTIDGNGEYWWEKFHGMRNEYEKRGLRWAVDYDCKRIRPVVIFRSEDVLLRGFTVKRAGFWTVTITYSDWVHVDGVTVRNNECGYGPSTDGINTDSSNNVLVENCDVDCNDDCLSVKSGRDADGLRVNQPAKNIVYRDCITRDGHGMFTIGSDMSGGARNIEIYNLEAKGTRNGIRFKSAKTRGGLVEDISIHNIRMDRVGCAFQWELDWFPDFSYPTIPDHIPEKEIPEHWNTMTEPVLPPKRGIPEFRNVSIRDVTARNTEERAWYVNAYSERPIQGIHFQDISVEASSAGEIHHATNWTMENVLIETPDGDGIELDDCENVDVPQVQ